MSFSHVTSFTDCTINMGNGFMSNEPLCVGSILE